MGNVIAIAASKLQVCTSCGSMANDSKGQMFGSLADDLFESLQDSVLANMLDLVLASCEKNEPQRQRIRLYCVSKRFMKLIAEARCIEWQIYDEEDMLKLSRHLTAVEDLSEISLIIGASLPFSLSGWKTCSMALQSCGGVKAVHVAGGIRTLDLSNCFLQDTLRYYHILEMILVSWKALEILWKGNAPNLEREVLSLPKASRAECRICPKRPRLNKMQRHPLLGVTLRKRSLKHFNGAAFSLVSP
jgi:hypothetical protein